MDKWLFVVNVSLDTLQVDRMGASQQYREFPRRFKVRHNLTKHTSILSYILTAVLVKVEFWLGFFINLELSFTFSFVKLILYFTKREPLCLSLFCNTDNDDGRQWIFHQFLLRSSRCWMFSFELFRDFLKIHIKFDYTFSPLSVNDMAPALYLMHLTSLKLGSLIPFKSLKCLVYVLVYFTKPTYNSLVEEGPTLHRSLNEIPEIIFLSWHIHISVIKHDKTLRTTGMFSKY